MDKKRIVLVSHNDILGGAAIVTYRLMKALQELGHDAKMLVFNKFSDDPDVILLAGHARRSVSFIGERAGIYLRNGRNRKDLFKVSTGNLGLGIANNKYVREADAIFLNWINQGTVSLGDIRKMAQQGKKIVWTMHDMWCMTGICHHSFGCDHFKEQCGNCPFLGSGASPNDISHKVWHKKKKLYEETDIKFVAVSNWVKKRAEESSLLKDKDITVIHNAFPSDRFPVAPIHKSSMLGLNNFKRIISMGAANLEDKVKGLEYAVKALNILYDESPEFAAGAVAVFFGEIQNPEALSDLRFPHIACGSLSDHDAIQQLYSHSDVILSTSLYETLGGTLIEGMSCGAIPVSFGEGGQTDIITHKKNGYIARYLDPRDVAEGIRWAFNSQISRESLHEEIRQRFNAQEIAQRYLSLI